MIESIYTIQQLYTTVYGILKKIKTQTVFPVYLVWTFQKASIDFCTQIILKKMCYGM